MPISGPPVVFAPRVNIAWERRGMLGFVESVLLLNILPLFLASQVLGVGLFFACRVVGFFFLSTLQYIR